MNTKEKVIGSPELLGLLNQTLELEYTLIIHYPRIASAIRDPETKQLAQSLGLDFPISTYLFWKLNLFKPYFL